MITLWGRLDNTLNAKRYVVYLNTKAVLSQGNRAMLQLFFSV